MNEHRDIVAAAIVGPTEQVENRTGARRRWQPPLLIKESIEGDTETGIKPTTVETDPPFNATS